MTGEPIARDRSNTYVLILALLIALSLMDRQLLAIVADQVKTEFHLSDTDVGLLGGTIFSISFTVASIPLAWSADRISRTGILTVCATFWALCTAAVGGANAFTALAAARVGLAIGEAGCNPCAQSLIADYVPPERRGRALAIYTMGGPAGLIAAGFLGGALADLYGWRMAFYVLGGASLAVAFIAAIVLPEPKRKGERLVITHASASAVDTSADTSKSYAALLRKPAFRFLMAGVALEAIAIYGGLIWGTTYIVRFFHWSRTEAGTMVALLGSVTALGGTWLGGYWSDWLSKRDARWMLWLPAIVLVLATPFSLAASFAPTIVVLFAGSTGETFFRTLSLAPAAAAIQRLATDATRARAAATSGVLGTLVGLGIGPPLVGAISDGLKSSVGEVSLQYGLAALAVPQLFAAYCNWRAASTLREELED